MSGPPPGDGVAAFGAAAGALLPFLRIADNFLWLSAMWATNAASVVGAIGAAEATEVVV